MLEGSEKPLSFFDLWQRYSLGIVAFAEAAGVEVEIVKDMLNNKPVPLPEAQKVFVQVSEMLKQQYAVEDFAIPLDTANELQNEIAHFLQQARYPPPWQDE